MCKCVNIEIGSYENQVELAAPSHLTEWAKSVDFSLGGDRNTVCIDKCLEREIKALWAEGITTTGCCCGHNRAGLAYIGVLEKDVNWMKAMGYKIRNAQSCAFIPMTIPEIPIEFIHAVENNN